jgi:hypothetical protein
VEFGAPMLKSVKRTAEPKVNGFASNRFAIIYENRLPGELSAELKAEYCTVDVRGF